MSQSAERKRRRADRKAGPGGPPTPEASRAAIEDLIAVWPRTPVVKAKVMDGAWVRSASIWVLAEHAVRTARAILLLDDQRMPMQCGPLARLVVECGVTAAWMAKRPRSGHALFKGAKRRHDELISGLADMAGVSIPDDDPSETEGLEQTKGEPSFRQRADFLDNGLWIYRYYRFLSAFSHGDGSLVQEYLEEGNIEHAYGHRYQFRDPEEFRWRHVVLALTVVTLNFALLAWNEVSENHELREPLSRVAEKHHLNSYPFNEDEDQLLAEDQPTTT